MNWRVKGVLLPMRTFYSHLETSEFPVVSNGNTSYAWSVHMCEGRGNSFASKEIVTSEEFSNDFV